MPARAPRKAPHTHRSPSYNDLQPGLVFSLPFGSLRSQRPDTSAGSSISSQLCESRSVDVLRRDNATPAANEHEPTVILSIRDNAGEKSHRPFHRCLSKESSSGGPSGFSTLPLRSSLTSSSSPLADQYLDTMVMDDFWRALCHRRIRQNQPKLHDLNRVKANSNASFVQKPARTLRKYKSKYHTKSRPSASVISRDKFAKKSISPGTSDSGFISSSPSPITASYLRVRSTRNFPVQNLIPTMSIDTSLSMIGRSCLSCKCTNTTCWRRTLGGIICNSCGLR
jgi:hypothetical protein